MLHSVDASVTSLAGPGKLLAFADGARSYATAMEQSVKSSITQTPQPSKPTSFASYKDVLVQQINPFFIQRVQGLASALSVRVGHHRDTNRKKSSPQFLKPRSSRRWTSREVGFLIETPEYRCWLLLLSMLLLHELIAGISGIHNAPGASVATETQWRRVPQVAAASRDRTVNNIAGSMIYLRHLA